MLQVNIQHFTKKELCCRCCGAFSMADYHLTALDNLRTAYGAALFPSSGCRCEKHNKAEGGKKTSRHECNYKKADATDLQPKFKNEEHFINELFKLYETAKSMKVFKEVILYIDIRNIKDSFVHVSTYPDKKSVYEHIKLRK